MCTLILAGCGNGTDDGDTEEPTVAVCEIAPPGERPVVALPAVTNTEEYTLVASEWGISSDGTNAIATTEGFQDALDWAEENSIGRFIVPAGDYLIGKPGNDIYYAGIELPGNMIFEMDPGATLTMDTNDKWNYCVIAIRNKQDVIVRGGHIIGDRDTHVYEGEEPRDPDDFPSCGIPENPSPFFGKHDEGHAICVEGKNGRILIEDMELSRVTGDGVLIVGMPDGEVDPEVGDITIRRNDIHHNRRQGVSVVGGIRILIEDNDIYNIHGASPQFGVDLEGAGRINRDIIVINNRFKENQGGDFVNTDAKNVWFEDNDCDQTGLVNKQSDGPIVHWGGSDQVVRGNNVTVTVGSCNGQWGLIGYSRNDPDRENRGLRGDNTQPNYFENNTFNSAGIHLAKTSHFVVRDNVITDSMILGYFIECLRLEDNDVSRESGFTYQFRNVAGEASGNIKNGEPVEFLMSDDSPHTNAPPSVW
tara:strand:- start:18095 stop:19522 length:1428 start_codon:yes stop_codon:yes gene_type:complete